MEIRIAYYQGFIRAMVILQPITHMADNVIITLAKEQTCKTFQFPIEEWDSMMK